VGSACFVHSYYERLRLTLSKKVHIMSGMNKLDIATRAKIVHMLLADQPRVIG
jgi:hypothetical protein